MTELEHYRTAIEYECYRKSGEHILVGGATGTGKTQTLYHIVNQLTQVHPKEAIVWFDTGKASEMLRLKDFRPLKIFIPEGKGIRLSPEVAVDIEVAHFNNADAIFDQIDPKKINVLSIEPYYIEAKDFLKILLDFFTTLFHRAYNYSIPVPMAIVIDELQGIAPGQGHAMSKKHSDAGVQMQRNIERLRALGVRVVGGTQDWTKLRKGVRQSFTWLFVKRGMYFSAFDKPTLAKYNSIWGHLKTNEYIVVFPDNYYANILWNCPFYGNGSKYGKVFYLQHSDDGTAPEEKESVAT